MVKRDFYKILKVSPSATAHEIKASYRKLAMELHPDRNDGCSYKLAQFKLVVEAYQTLSSESERNSYDYKSGYRYNKNRRTPPPPNYRKVYAPHPPPEWKGRTWDHELHYKMHYGSGQYEEAMREARRRTGTTNGEKQQPHDRNAGFYRSPIGRGFSFDPNNPNINFNPYSKHSEQGPQASKEKIEYEESYINMDTGKTSFNKRKRAVDDLHAERNERIAAEAARIRREQARYKSPFDGYPDEATAGTCIIL